MKKRAVIVGTMHPKGLMRAQVRVMPDWNGVDDADLPWAEYLMPIGNGFVPTITGDLVWIEFPYTNTKGEPDTRRPLIVGAAESAIGGVPNVAPEASGQGSPYTPNAVEGAPARPSTSKTKDFVLDRNNLLEVRSAGGGYEIANKAAGSRIGMNEAGEPYMISPKGGFFDFGGDVTFRVGGELLFKSEGETKLVSQAAVSVQAVAAFDVKASNYAFD